MKTNLFKLLLQFIALLMLIACNRVGESGQKPIEGGEYIEIITPIEDGQDLSDTIGESTSATSVVKPTQKIHIFIENSGSMNGYINSASDFQMAIGRAIQLMKYQYGDDNIKTYYINTKISQTICPEGTDLYLFVQQMLQKTQFTKSGNTSSTDLNQVVKNVLDSVDSNNTAILISDFIYSLPSTSGVTESLLYGCQNLTMSAFLNKTKVLQNGVSLATSLVQLYSSFNGHYWHWEKPTGNQYVNLVCSRPYYMCIIGTDENVKCFNNNIETSSLRGYKNQFTISNKDVSKATHSVFDTKYKKGSYRHQNSNSIHAISNVKKNSKGEFELGVGINLSDFTMSESDKLDLSNYHVERGNYQIVRVEKIDTTTITNPTDKKLVRKNNITHAIILSSKGFPNDVSISIKRRLPIWIKETSSIDDRNIANDNNEQGKTFGLEYFVKGISDAYNYLSQNKQDFMTINIKVTN